MLNSIFYVNIIPILVKIGQLVRKWHQVFKIQVGGACPLRKIMLRFTCDHMWMACDHTWSHVSVRKTHMFTCVWHVFTRREESTTHVYCDFTRNEWKTTCEKASFTCEPLHFTRHQTWTLKKHIESHVNTCEPYVDHRWTHWTTCGHMHAYPMFFISSPRVRSRTPDWKIKI
jgi:hypothetical protein